MHPCRVPVNVILSQFHRKCEMAIKKIKRTISSFVLQPYSFFTVIAVDTPLLQNGAGRFSHFSIVVLK